MKATIKLGTDFSQANFMYAVKEGGVVIRPFQDSNIFTGLDGSLKEYVVKRKSDAKEFTKSKVLNMFSPIAPTACSITFVASKVVAEVIPASGPTGGSSGGGSGSGSGSGGTIETPPPTPPEVEEQQQAIEEKKQQELLQETNTTDPYPIEDILLEVE
jgi:hypothetical protein